MTAQSDLGPVLPSRAVLHRCAREIEALARIAADCTIGGPHCDTARAVALLGRINSLSGGEESFSDPAKEPDRVACADVACGSMPTGSGRPDDGVAAWGRVHQS